MKYGTFIPPKQSPYELSVYRVDGLQEYEIWQLTVENVETERRKTKARADLICQDALDLQLEVKPEPTRHYRHANITGWEEKDLEDLKFAVQLASKATLIIKPQLKS